MNVCPQNAIFFEKDENGFLYPSVDESKCVNCKVCELTCDKKNNIALSEPIKSFAAINKNKDVLLKSSSGGVFSALAEIVLGRGGVVYGAMMDENLIVRHIGVETVEDLRLLRGSKYVQSNIGDCFRQAKENLLKGRYVLFTGTPCQISGLYAFLNKDYEKLITADFVCHGTPSQEMFNKFVAYLEEKHQEKITGFNFRAKNRTWLRFEESFSTPKKEYNRIGKFEEFYHTCFTSGHIIQDACFSCRFATRKRCSDFTMCDFWGFQKANLHLNEKNGLSALMFNSERSLGLSDEINKYLTLEEVSYDFVVNGNTFLKGPIKKGTYRDYYLTAYRNDTIKEAAEQYCHNRKKFIRKQNFLYHLPYFLYKLRRFGIKKDKNRI